jgi:hypothetical protein
LRIGTFSAEERKYVTSGAEHGQTHGSPTVFEGFAKEANIAGVILNQENFYRLRTLR